MFTQTVDYALRAMVALASDPEQSKTTEELAEKTRVPKAYLSKVLQSLKRSGLIFAQRGLGGGVRLAHSPDDVTILAVVNTVDPIRRIHTCPLKIASHGTSLCSLHREVDDALAVLEATFAEKTLAQLLPEEPGGNPFCDPADTEMQPLVTLGG